MAKTNRSSPRRLEQKLGAALGEAETQLYVLINFGERFEQCPFDVFNVSLALEAVTQRMRILFNDIAARLPKGHPARAEISKCVAAVDTLDTFIGTVRHAHEADQLKPSPEFKRMVGKGIIGFVAECGRAIERSMSALGNNLHISGFLRGYLIEGELDLLNASDDESELVRIFRNVTPLGKSRMLALASECEGVHSLADAG